MKRLRLLFFLLLTVDAVAYSQGLQMGEHRSKTRITHQYHDVPLSEALLQLNNEQSYYTINFLYNELEDFRITTTVSHKSLPDAIQQMIGFYPVRMTVNTAEREIYVECIHKSNRHLTGTIVDEQGLPLCYANIALLSPQDSTLISGGVSNESGYFAIPFERLRAGDDMSRMQPTVLARISYVGYKTIYKLCTPGDAGTIRMESETYTINGIQVKGERTIVKAENGHFTYQMPQLLEILPADDAYEALTRIPGVTETGDGLTFAGREVTLIINGKPTTLSAAQVIERLKQIPSSQLVKAEVLPSAPAKYHARGMVINVITQDYVGTHQLMGQVQGHYRQDKYGYGQTKGNLIYQNGNLGLDASYTYGYGNAYGKVEHEAHHPLGIQRVDYSDRTDHKSRHISHNYHIGLDYAFAENNRLNLAYTGEWESSHANNTTTGLETAVQRAKLHDYLHNVDATYSAPFGMQLNASFTHYQNPHTQQLDSKLYEETRHLLAESNQRISKWLFTADQTHELHNNWELNYGVEAQFTGNDSYQTTLDATGNELADATSHVNYKERILNIYTGFSKEFSPAFSLETSVAAEQYHAPGWNDWRLYPSFSAMWQVNESNSLNLSLSSETIYPSYWSTMNSIFYSSAYSEIWGNPNLKPASSYNLDLMWQLKQRYTFIAFACFQPDYSVQLAYQPADRMAVIMKETNFDYSNYYGLQSSIRFNAGQWLNGTINVTGLYKHDQSDQFFDLPFNRRQLSGIVSANVSAKLSAHQNIQLMLNPFFQSKAIQGIYDIDPMFTLNASLRWTLPNNKWSFIINGNNIFNGHANTHSSMGNQDYTMRVWMNYAEASLKAIYRIGSFKEKKTKAVDTSRMGY